MTDCRVLRSGRTSPGACGKDLRTVKFKRKNWQRCNVVALSLGATSCHSRTILFGYYSNDPTFPLVLVDVGGERGMARNEYVRRILSHFHSSEGTDRRLNDAGISNVYFYVGVKLVHPSGRKSEVKGCERGRS